MPSPSSFSLPAEAAQTAAVRCAHGHTLRRCPECHSEFCQSAHNGRTGWGCDEHRHDRCSGFTRGYETYQCDCICCCLYWPTPKERPHV